ncbi:MAG TPA: response regulator transcription factor [Chloroflexota bacterium]|nr:response regulator transcription factor [Chloroflexota bacterium]
MDILVVDDDPDIVDIISYSLRKDGHRVISGQDGQEALDLARKHHPDLAILDVMMPKQNGFEVCRRLRQESTIPIILLTAKGEEADKVWGLDLGADDYMTKPFSHKELLARVRAVGRRAAASGIREDHGTLESGVLRMDLDRHEVRLGDRPAELTPKEFDLLHCLMLNAGKVVTHENLLNFAWGSNCDGDTEMLKVHIRHLREKIERNPSAPEHVLTIRGVGYKLAVS